MLYDIKVFVKPILLFLSVYSMKIFLLIILLLIAFYLIERKNRYDIVITWVNLTGDINDYIELRYLLRSICNSRFPYGSIYIVHSDYKIIDGIRKLGPPTYLKETSRLKFISHQSLGCNYEISRACQIPFLFNRIRGLSNHFFHIEDDQFVMNRNVFYDLIRQHRNKQVKVNMVKYVGYDKILNSSVPIGGEKQWVFGQMNAGKLLGAERYSFDIHTIKFYDKNILNKIETLYPTVWDKSKRLINPFPSDRYRCNLWSLFSGYLMEKLNYTSVDLLDNGDYIEIHTNGFNEYSHEKVVRQ